MQQNINLLINKVNALNADAWMKRVSDSAVALELSKEAARIAKSINYTKGTAEALRTLGFSYIRISKHKDALEYLQEALAFYACTERSRSAVNQHASTGSAGQDYQPTVSVSTKKSENSVIITVSDNGTGIPQSIVNKIFQPFFTTKPTGEGTGLGLSLSYDIIKAHGGEIKVESKEGEGSVLVIKLPI